MVADSWCSSIQRLNKQTNKQTNQTENQTKQTDKPTFKALEFLSFERGWS